MPTLDHTLLSLLASPALRTVVVVAGFSVAALTLLNLLWNLRKGAPKEKKDNLGLKLCTIFGLLVTCVLSQEIKDLNMLLRGPAQQHAIPGGPSPRSGLDHPPSATPLLDPKPALGSPARPQGDPDDVAVSPGGSNSPGAPQSKFVVGDSARTACRKIVGLLTDSCSLPRSEGNKLLRAHTRHLKKCLGEDERFQPMLQAIENIEFDSPRPHRWAVAELIRNTIEGV